MRISEMLNREDFFEILKATVKDYYKSVYNRDVVFTYEKEDDVDELIINHKLGFITSFPACKGLMKFLLSEYNIRGNFIKYVLGKLIAFFVSIFPQIGKYKNAYISKDALKDVFIYPQNRSIRFFNYKEMTVDCIIKKGFSTRYFNNQLKFRLNNSYDFLIPLIDHGENWFRERILEGHPLARTTNQKLYQKGILDSIESIRKIADKTIKYESSENYCDQLTNKLFFLIENAKSKKTVKSIEQIKKLIFELKTQVVNANFSVPLVISHGDLQAGNIWVDKQGKIWIYDWETVDTRSIWYDVAVLKYSIRRDFGLKEFIEAKEVSELFVLDPLKDSNMNYYMNIKALILLEDIDFYLEDLLELPENWGAEVFDGYMQRLLSLYNKENSNDKE